jgi:lipid-A-disaccharide synthase
VKYYLISGERSGDLHAGNLIKALKKEDTNGQVRSWGGEYVEAAGAELVVHYRELAIMGFLEVLKAIFKIKRYLKFCKQDILKYRPDVVILVDYGGFNMRIAKFCKANNIRVFYYIAPKVWAWNQSRANKLKATVDQLFCILPFEEAFFKKYDWDVDYVGNPVVDAVNAHQVDEDFISKYQLPSDKPIVALLPGSRNQELANMLPIMEEVVSKFPQYHFAVGAINSFDNSVYEQVATLDNVSLVHEDTYNLMAHSKAAIVTSGTATLETALWNVPQVVAYKTGALNYYIGKLVVKVAYISLVNLIADRQVVKELIQEEMNAKLIGEELENLMTGSRREEVLTGYKEVKEILGNQNASENTAKLMVSYLDFK